MDADQSVYLLLADIGFGTLDRIRIDMPHRVIDFGAREQLMIGAACGMALSGKRPVCYSITPFVLYRPFEWVRNFLSHDQIPVKLIGIGRGADYATLGHTHCADDDSAILATLPGIAIYKPDAVNLARDFDAFMDHDGPAYINIAK